MSVSITLMFSHISLAEEYEFNKFFSLKAQNLTINYQKTEFVLGEILSQVMKNRAVMFLSI